MRRLVRFVALPVALLLSACSTDLMSPDASQKTQVIVAAAPAASCTVSPLNSYVVASITNLMQVLTPNNSSAQSKWQQVLDAIAANDPVAAQTALNGLIDFINLKYGQASTSGVTILDPITGLPVPIADFKNKLFLDMQCYVDQNLFDLNPGDPAKVFVDQVTEAGVYFPSDFVPQGYNVEVTTPTTSPLSTLFDQYPSYIDIKLKDANGNEPPPGTTFNTANGLPVVVVCFPIGIDPTVADRLLLGHQGSSGFELLDKVNVPQALANALDCGGNLPIAMSPAERMLRKAAEWLLPEKAYAAYFAFGGVGGSPEEFSPFGAVDRGLLGGGAGGSPEEFAPGMMPSANGPMTSTVSGGGTNVTGTADETNVTDPLQLPKIRVTTPSGLSGIDGVVVTFELLAPDASGSDPITGPNSSATLCGATTVTTSGGGYASVPCINFGTTLGYKNLKATFDPSGANPLACIINAQGLCATATASVNFLVQTVSGAAAKLVLVSSPASAQAGKPFTVSVRLRDQNNNDVDSSGVSVGVALAGGSAGALAGTTPVTTDANGVVTFSLTINGVIGSRTFDFGGTGLTGTSATVNITAGDATRLKMVNEPAASWVAGLAPTTQPSVQVVDNWDNPVAASATVTASLADGAGTLAGTLDASTNGSGLATFTDLRIDGSTATTRTLKFESAQLTGVTSATTITITPGAATKLVMVTQPSASAAAGAPFGTQPSVKLQDAFDNDVTSPQVSVAAAITAGGAPALAGTTSVLTSDGVASFTNLRIDGVIGSRTLTFTSGPLTAAVSNAVNITAGAATVIQTFMPPAPAAASFSYGNLAEATAVSPAPQVRVTDTFGNPVDGAAVTWSPLNAANGAGAVVGSGNSTSGGGLARITSWTTGQGTSTLNASIAGSGTLATFTATAQQVVIAACTASGSLKKVDLAKYSGTSGGYLGSLTTKAVNAGLVRSAELAMSVTGQSSGPGGYPTAIRAYRAASGELIASGTPYNAAAPTNQTLLIPGDNGSPALIRFNLAPVAGKAVTVGEVIRFEVQVTAASNRTFQVWYNTRTTAGTTCAESKLVGTTIKGVNLSTRNYSY